MLSSELILCTVFKFLFCPGLDLSEYLATAYVLSNITTYKCFLYQ